MEEHMQFNGLSGAYWSPKKPIKWKPKNATEGHVDRFVNDAIVLTLAVPIILTGGIMLHKSTIDPSLGFGTAVLCVAAICGTVGRAMWAASRLPKLLRGRS
jgi:hypothetical protein